MFFNIVVRVTFVIISTISFEIIIGRLLHIFSLFFPLASSIFFPHFSSFSFSFVCYRKFCFLKQLQCLKSLLCILSIVSFPLSFFCALSYNFASFVRNAVTQICYVEISFTCFPLFVHLLVQLLIINDYVIIKINYY